MHETYTQRMRVLFATRDSVKWVGHLDFVRAWERAVRRSGLPLAYSQGFNAQARLHFAAALPVGFTGEAELVDVFLNDEIAPPEFLVRLQAALPEGIVLRSAMPVTRETPSLQSQVISADYRVDVAQGGPELEGMLAAMMARSEVWRERRRGDKPPVHYDLRPLIESYRFIGPAELGQSFEVTMRAAPGANGRPDELLAELGLAEAPRSITRLRLHFADEAEPAPGSAMHL